LKVIIRKQRFFEKKRAKNFCWWPVTAGVSLIAPAWGDQRDTGGDRPPAKVFLVTFFSKKVTACLPALPLN